MPGPDQPTTVLPAKRPSAPALHSVSDTRMRIEYRTVHGYRRAFRIAGSGPALLLIHGIGDNSSTWDDVIPTLAQHYTVIAPDLLGHGLSDKPRADYSVAAFANGMRDLLVVLGIPKVTGSVTPSAAVWPCSSATSSPLRRTPGAGRRRWRHARGQPVLRLVTLPGAGEVLAMLRIPGVLPALRWGIDTLADVLACPASPPTGRRAGSCETTTIFCGWSAGSPTRTRRRRSCVPCTPSSTGAASRSLCSTAATSPSGYR